MENSGVNIEFLHMELTAAVQAKMQEEKSQILCVKTGGIKKHKKKWRHVQSTVLPVINGISIPVCIDVRNVVSLWLSNRDPEQMYRLLQSI